MQDSVFANLHPEDLGVDGLWLQIFYLLREFSQALGKQESVLLCVENGKRVFREIMAPTQTWREIWGPPLMFSYESPTDPTAKRSEPLLLTYRYV